CQPEQQQSACAGTDHDRTAAARVDIHDRYGPTSGETAVDRRAATKKRASQLPWITLVAMPLQAQTANTPFTVVLNWPGAVEEIREKAAWTIDQTAQIDHSAWEVG